MQVTVSIRRAIVVDNDIDSLDVNTATEDISCNKDTGIERLEGLIATDTEYSYKTKVRME